MSGSDPHADDVSGKNSSNRGFLGKDLSSKGSSDDGLPGVSAPAQAAARAAHAVAATVDARGMACPLPILKAKKALSQLESGQILSVSTTDRNAVRDFQAFCTQSRNVLLEQVQTDTVCTHFIARR